MKKDVVFIFLLPLVAASLLCISISLFVRDNHQHGGLLLKMPAYTIVVTNGADKVIIAITPKMRCSIAEKGEFRHYQLIQSHHIVDTRHLIITTSDPKCS